MIDLKDLRMPKGVRDKDLISEVKGLYPKYDKTLHSKCKRQEYGITLREDATKALVLKFNLEPVAAPQRARGDGHRYTRRISCRLPDATYDKLQLYINADGYETVQSWLSDQVETYIQFKEKSKIQKENKL